MLLVTRTQMYATVYFHRTLRVAERMIERAFRLAIEAGEIKPEQLPQMDDAAATMLLRHSKTDAWRLMLSVDQRHLLKVALEEPYVDVAEGKLAALAQDPAWQARVEAEIAVAAKLPPHEVILDVPDPPALPEVEARVLLDDGRVVGLSDASSLVRTLHHAQRDHWRMRVLAPASRRADVALVAPRVLRRELA
jgi:HD superfamily phosphohydrolase